MIEMRSLRAEVVPIAQQEPQSGGRVAGGGQWLQHASKKFRPSSTQHVLVTADSLVPRPALSPEKTWERGERTWERGSLSGEDLGTRLSLQRRPGNEANSRGVMHRQQKEYFVPLVPTGPTPIAQIRTIIRKRLES